MYYVTFDQFNGSLLNKSIIIFFLLFCYRSLSLSLYIQYLTDSSVTKVLLISSWVKLSNIECTFRFFKNSKKHWIWWLYEQIRIMWFCDKLQGVVSLEAMILRAPERADRKWERSRWVTESSLLALNHICAWHGGNALQEVRLKSSHTPAYTQCPSLSVVHRQQKLSVFTWGTLGFHSSRCRGSVCAFQSLEFEITSQLCLANNHRNSNT